MRDIKDIAVDVLECAESWAPEACLMGSVRADEVALLARAVTTVVELSAYGHFERCHGEEPDDPAAIEALKTRVRVHLGSTDIEDRLEVDARALDSVSTFTRVENTKCPVCDHKIHCHVCARIESVEMGDDDVV